MQVLYFCIVSQLFVLFAQINMKDMQLVVNNLWLKQFLNVLDILISLILHLHNHLSSYFSLGSLKL